MAMFWKDTRNADVQLQLCTSSSSSPAPASATSGQQQPPSDGPDKLFQLHSFFLVSASPYFKARCWSDNAEGQLQYAHDALAPVVVPVDTGKRKRAEVPPLLLLIEHVEEEELPAMEACCATATRRSCVMWATVRRS